jgi:hypothetical protein
VYSVQCDKHFTYWFVNSETYSKLLGEVTGVAGNDLIRSMIYPEPKYLKLSENLAICIQKEKDTAQHTVESCPAWAQTRRVLQLVIGEGLAPEAAVEAMLRGPHEFNAVRSFCEQVMLVKERSERSRESMRDPVRTAHRRDTVRGRPRRHHRRRPPRRVTPLGMCR